MTAAACSLTSFAWIHFQIGSHLLLCLGTGMPAHSNFVGSRVYVCLRCDLPPALLAEWPGSFTCYCGNTGVEWTPNKSQHTKLTLEKKILPPLLPGFELATFRSRVRRSYQQASLASHTHSSIIHEPKLRKEKSATVVINSSSFVAHYHTKHVDFYRPTLVISGFLGEVVRSKWKG